MNPGVIQLKGLKYEFPFNIVLRLKQSLTEPVNGSIRSMAVAKKTQTTTFSNALKITMPIKEVVNITGILTMLQIPRSAVNMERCYMFDGAMCLILIQGQEGISLK